MATARGTRVRGLPGCPENVLPPPRVVGSSRPYLSLRTDDVGTYAGHARQYCAGVSRSSRLRLKPQADGTIFYVAPGKF